MIKPWCCLTKVKAAQSLLTRIVEENLHIMFSESTPNVVGTQSNGFAGTKATDNASQARKEIEPSSHDDGSNPSSDDGKKVDEDPRKDSECNDQEKEYNVNNTNNVNAASTNEVNDLHLSREEDWHMIKSREIGLDYSTLSWKHKRPLRKDEEVKK
ncbi:hypothetical protein Tco_0173447 [Tanacetum coccineum]